MELRFSIFLVTFLFLVALEHLLPDRKQIGSKKIRWTSNLGMSVLSNILLKVLLPWLAIDASLWAAENQFGLFNQLELNEVLVLGLSFLLLDFAIYLQHILSHRINFLWSYHKVHHSDVDLDTTTALRFHPIEILLSMFYKIFWVVVMGSPIQAVIIFEIALNATAMFNHANLKLPVFLDRFLKLFLVTPYMHKVHHSIVHKEMNSNFGFNLPWWDYLFKTYKYLDKDQTEKMPLGLENYRKPEEQKLDWVLRLPFMN